MAKRPSPSKASMLSLIHISEFAQLKAVGKAFEGMTFRMQVDVLDCLGSVSYTHLDVYKRQIYKGVKAMKPWVKVSTCPVGKYKDTSRYPSRGWNAFHTCLLYTSRCV